MKTNPNDELIRSLCAARWRMRLHWFLDRFVTFALVAGLGLVLAGAVQRWLLHRAPPPLTACLGVLGGAVLFAGCAVLAQRIALPDVAELVDRLGQTRDRFLTALSFSKTPTPFHDLAARECRAFVAGKKFAQLVPVRVPRAAVALLVPVIALALLHWEAGMDAEVRRRAAEAAQAEASPTAERLEKLAKEIEKAHAETPDADLKKMAEQLRKSAEQLRAQDNGAEEAAKAALRELSNLEQMLQQMQKPPASASPEEMKQLANALEQNDATKSAAEAMKAGNLAQAAKELDDAAKQEPTKEEAEKAIKQALDHLASQRQLSEALQELAKQAQQSGQGGPSSETMQKLAEMLRKMGGKPQQGGGAGGKPMSEQALKNLMAALENMKFGEGQNPDGKPQAGGDGKVAMQSFGKPNPGDGSPSDGGQVPSGQPGSEHDTGTTETPFGKDSAAHPDKGSEASAKGRLGEGESLSQMLPSAGDKSKSQRRYKELYEALAPAAEEAVVQENIPLGSRFFIKRYFESIRPKE